MISVYPLIREDLDAIFYGNIIRRIFRKVGNYWSKEG